MAQNLYPSEDYQLTKAELMLRAEEMERDINVVIHDLVEADDELGGQIMDKPVLSDNFTLEDLRALRQYNSLRHVAMSREEISRELEHKSRLFEQRMLELRQNI